MIFQKKFISIDKQDAFLAGIDLNEFEFALCETDGTKITRIIRKAKESLSWAASELNSYYSVKDQQSLNLGYLAGKYIELRVYDVLTCPEFEKPFFFKGVRRASLYEEAQEKDFIIETDIGDFFLQITVSKFGKGKQKKRVNHLLKTKRNSCKNYKPSFNCLLE